jgi:hypothetical protein
MAYDPVEEWLLSIMHDPKVQLRWRTECAALLLDHQRRAPVRYDPVDINIKIVIEGLGEQTYLATEVGPRRYVSSVRGPGVLTSGPSPLRLN